MEKIQDSGLACFLIVMKFFGVPVTKEQAESLSLLQNEEKTNEIDIVSSAKAMKMRAKICRLDVMKLKRKLNKDRIDVYDTLLTADEDTDIDASKYDEDLLVEIDLLEATRDSIKSNIANLLKDKETAELNKQIAQLQADEYRQENKELMAQLRSLR